MYTYVHSFFFMACIIDRTYWVVEASWNAETKSSTSLNTITKFHTAHNIDREPRAKREILFHVVVLARSTTPSHAIYLEGRNGLAATFVNDSEFESSKGLPELAIGRVAMLYLFGKTILVFALFSFIPSVPTCAGGRAKHNPTRGARRPDRVWPMRIDLSANIPLRIRPNKGRRAYPFLTYSHTTVFFLLYLYRLRPRGGNSSDGGITIWIKEENFIA